MDDRTTPRSLQPLALVALLGLAVYFLTASRWALDNSDAPRWIREHPAYTWFGGWKMFTELDRDASRVDAEIQVAGEWKPIDLEALFPTEWESGPRYARTWFRKSTNAMKVLAHATCERAGHPDRVRFTVTTWRKKLGRVAKPPKDAKPKPILDWDCGESVPRPPGRPL